MIVEHRVEEALELLPDRVLYLEDGATRYLGPLDGFLSIADPRAVKLPFDVVLGRAQRGELAEPAPGACAPGSTDVRCGRRRLDSSSARSHAAIGHRTILHGVDAALGRRRDRGHPRTERLGQDDRAPDGDAICCR